jgi:DNA processing protein
VAGPKIIQPLIDAGITIVSGLAFGVDSQMQALSVKSGKRTIAVLGGGLDERSFYPKEHQLLADQILENGGAIISEHPIGTPPLKFNFVARNRIISGMCVGTVLIECNLKSGTLITAQLTADQNRELFAVPGPIYADMSQGPNTWIKRGATPVTEAEDIFSVLRIVPPWARRQAADKPIMGDNVVENKILSQLSLQPIMTDDLIKLTHLPAGDVTAALTFLEIKGKIKNLGSQQYILNK